MALTGRKLAKRSSNLIFSKGKMIFVEIIHLFINKPDFLLCGRMEIKTHKKQPRTLKNKII